MHMNRLTASILALGLAAAAGTASAQSSGYGPNDNGYYSQAGSEQGAYYDYARVLRVDPVIQSGTGYYGTSNTSQRCYQRPGSHAGNDPYNRDGYARNDGYNDGYNGNDPYYPQQQDGYGTTTGRTIATVLGGVLGAAIGSQVGGGSARYATSAIGSMVGGIAGRQVYENTQRNRAYNGTVTVCDPEPVRDGYGNGNGNYPVNDGRVTAYDVTYEYGGRSHVTRTNYHPGDRIRVRVDVRPE
jgi:uncharacterized protein YcfJ